MLPPGGARNALDAALWDLEAKQTGTPVWQRAGVGNRPVASVFTIGIRSVDEYERRASELAHLPWLKIKVNDQQPFESIAAVRRGSPSARLVVDPNQAWDLRTLDALAPRLVDLRVDLLEQPVPIGVGDQLVAGRCPIPVCADEAVNTVADLPKVVGRYDFVNIKLDKSGGLTAALELAHAARAAGMRLMVGCMNAGSIAMAPGHGRRAVVRSRRSRRAAAAGGGLARRHRLRERRHGVAFAAPLGLSRAYHTSDNSKERDSRQRSHWEDRCCRDSCSAARC